MFKKKCKLTPTDIRNTKKISESVRPSVRILVTGAVAYSGQTFLPENGRSLVRSRATNHIL